MGCTPSKKELEKQTGERPGDEPVDQTNGKPKNGALKKNNEEIVRAKAPVTLTPNGGDADALRISTLDGLPSDIKFIDADEESLMRASVQDVTAAEAVTGTPQEDDPAENSKEIEERIECMIETNIEATPNAGGVDPAADGAKSEDRYCNNKAFEEPDIDPSNPDQQDAALKIQTTYRKHRATEEVQELREEQAAVKIQAGIRGYQDRQKVKAMKVDSEKAATAEDAGKGEAAPQDDIDLNDPEVQEAATKIQAGFRGHKARKEVNEMKQQDDKDKEIDLSDPEAAAAATKIQASFRGHMARKDLHESQKVNDPVEVDDPADEEVDIDLSDPDVEKAAVKIQASFRGFQSRKGHQVHAYL